MHVHGPSNDRVRFTEGDCHVLAQAINEITGWPICTFVTAWHGTATLHAFNKHPSGDFVDVEGRQSPMEFQRAWTTRLLIKEWDGLDEMKESGWWTQPRWDDSPGRAAALAPSIIEAAD